MENTREGDGGREITPVTSGAAPDKQSPPRPAEEMEAWMIAHLAAELGIEPKKVDTGKPLARYGLDSMSAVILAGELEAWLARPLPPDLLDGRATVASVAQRLASGAVKAAPPTPSEQSQRTLEKARTDDELQARPRFQKIVSTAIALLAHILTRTRIEGLDNLPRSRPFLIAANHLHVMDPALLHRALPQGTAFLVAEDMRRKWPIIEWVMAHLGPTIYVSRGEADWPALSRSVSWLRGGGILAMAPEGKVSRTGGLLEGRTGMAYLATEAGVPVVPVAAFGQEKADSFWRRLRRVPIAIRIGTPITLPAGRATAKQLEAHTARIMAAMAQLLPPEYQGIYGRTDVGEGL